MNSTSKMNKKLPTKDWFDNNNNKRLNIDYVLMAGGGDIVILTPVRFQLFCKCSYIVFVFK